MLFIHKDFIFLQNPYVNLSNKLSESCLLFYFKAYNSNIIIHIIKGMPSREWKPAMNRFQIEYGEQFIDE